MLFRVIHHHYGPKSSSSDLAYVVACKDEEALIAWLDEKENFGGWACQADTEYSVSPHKEFQDEFLRRAREMNASGATLRIDERDMPYWLTIYGKHAELLRLQHGDIFEEVVDAYYGVNRWSWEKTDKTDGPKTRLCLSLVLGDRFVVIDSDLSTKKED